MWSTVKLQIQLSHNQDKTCDSKSHDCLLLGSGGTQLQQGELHRWLLFVVFILWCTCVFLVKLPVKIHCNQIIRASLFGPISATEPISTDGGVRAAPRSTALQKHLSQTWKVGCCALVSIAGMSNEPKANKFSQVFYSQNTRLGCVCVYINICIYIYVYMINHVLHFMFLWPLQNNKFNWKIIEMWDTR